VSPDDEDGVTFLGRRLGPAFETRVVTVEPGAALPYAAAQWRDALVVVERGEIELEAEAGGRRHLATGAVLWLAGLPLRALHNPGREPAVLVAVSRRAADRVSAPGTGPPPAACAPPRRPAAGPPTGRPPSGTSPATG
jgi:quercetin dioxygenase-like cupin family protein